MCRVVICTQRCLALLGTLWLVLVAVAAAADAPAQFGVAALLHPVSPFDTWLVAIVSTTLLAGALGWLWSVRLRRQLAARTQDLQHANAALRESEGRLRILLQTIPDPVWLKDLDGRYMLCNRRLEQAFGAPADEIIGKTDSDFVESNTADGFRAHDQAVIASGQATTNEEEMVFANDGHQALIQTIKTPVYDAQGQMIGVLGIARDITTLKQVEQELQQHRHHLQEMVEARTHALTDERQRLANILEGTRAGTWEWNVQTGQTRFNERWAEIIGYRLEELAPVDLNTWLRFVHPDDWQYAQTLVERHLARELDYYECEVRMRHRDDRWVWVLVRGKLVCRDAKDQPLWMAGTHIDITLLKDVEQALIQAKEQAEQATLDKSRFLANMSHEIRTPMNAIMGLAYLLEHQHLPKEAQDLAAKIHHSGQSLLGIINDILDLSKIESGKIDLEQIPFQLTTVLDNLATIMAATAERKALELVIVPPPCSDWPLLGDPLRLGQILINLTSNAIKFTDAGLIEVRIEPIEANATQIWLRFAIKDTGIGIAEATKARLFQPFAQADSSTTRHFGGSGLGLVISRRLVELMGGHMDLISRVGEGSTFWFELPFERLTQDTLSTRPSVPIHVLVVEDKPSVCDGLLATVAALGWSGRAMGSGEAALRQLLDDPTLQGPQAVVLLDWQGSGADMQATVQAIHAALPPTHWPLLMVLTAEPVNQIQERLNASRVDAVLSKPLTSSPLYDAVVRARNGRLGERVVPAPPVRQTRRLVGVRLLVVDDSDINREVAHHILANEGAQVCLANDGQQALDWLLAHPQTIDLVLMDVQMPVMDGHEATRRMRQDERLAHLPVIALTAGAMRAQEVEAEQAGMNAFLSKPFDVEEAVLLILRLTREHRHGAVANPAVAPRPAVSPPSAGNLPGLALDRALAIWKDAEIYRRYLRRFTQEYADIVMQIRAASAEETERLAHRLKGAAGNLGVDQVADCAAKLEQVSAIPEATEQLETATVDLQAALDTALTSIADYVAESLAAAPLAGAPEATTRAPERPDLASLIHAAYSAFRNFDPISAEEPLSQLAQHLPAEQLTAIQDAVEQLDAAAGEAAIWVLANQLHMDLEGEA